MMTETNQIPATVSVNDNKTEFETLRARQVARQADRLGRQIEQQRFKTAWLALGQAFRR